MPVVAAGGQRTAMAYYSQPNPCYKRGNTTLLVKKYLIMNTKDLVLFVRTADSGSITRAAEQLDITTAAASAALKRLEQQLKVQLFIRSTRQLRISAEGERFLVYCRKALAELDAGRASIHALAGKVAGELRISAPSDIGRNLLPRWIDDIMEQHPDLSIHLLLGDAVADFYMDRINLAIRYGNQQDSSLVAFKLATIDRVVCASPAYLRRFGTPQTPADLLQHNCLLFQLNNRTHDVWEFIAAKPTPADSTTAKSTTVKNSATTATEHHHEHHHERIRVRSNRCANDGEMVRRWALAGRGIAYKSRLDINDDLRTGRLVRILPQYQSDPIDLNLVSPGRQQITPAALLLRDILRQKFAEVLALEQG